MSSQLIDEYLENLQTEFIILPTLFGIYKLYQRFLSVAARKCMGMSGKKKTTCMLLYKLETFKIAKRNISKYKKLCKYTMTPKSCVKEVTDQIQKIEQRIDKTMQELNEVMEKI